MVDSKENYKFELGVKGLIRNYNGYDLLCSVIDLQNSRLPVDQSDVNWNQSLMIHSQFISEVQAISMDLYYALWNVSLSHQVLLLYLLDNRL